MDATGKFAFGKETEDDQETPERLEQKGVWAFDSNISKFKKALMVLEEEAQRRSLRLDEWGRMDAIRSQLWLWMIRQERYWRQLSRCKLIREGDRNTKYFHLTASLRRQRNGINKLLINGVEVADENEIKRRIIGFFKDLYNKQQGTSFDIS